MKKEYVPNVVKAGLTGAFILAVVVFASLQGQVVNPNGAGPQAQGTAAGTNPPANPTNAFGGNQRIQAEVYWLDGAGQFDGWQPTANSNWGISGEGLFTNGIQIPSASSLPTASSNYAWSGRAQLTAGQYTVAQTNINSNDIVLLTQEMTPTGAPGAMLEVSNLVQNTGFTVYSVSNGILAGGATYTNWFTWVIIRH